jgi:hypothetical protein
VLRNAPASEFVRAFIEHARLAVFRNGSATKLQIFIRKAGRTLRAFVAVDTSLAVRKVGLTLADRKLAM